MTELKTPKNTGRVPDFLNTVENTQMGKGCLDIQKLAQIDLDIKR